MSEHHCEKILKRVRKKEENHIKWLGLQSNT